MKYDFIVYALIRMYAHIIILQNNILVYIYFRFNTLLFLFLEYTFFFLEYIYFFIFEINLTLLSCIGWLE